MAIGGGDDCGRVTGRCAVGLDSPDPGFHLAGVVAALGKNRYREALIDSADCQVPSRLQVRETIGFHENSRDFLAGRCAVVL